MSLWFHDGSGRGFPALEVGRRVEQVNVEAQDGGRHVEDRIYRDLVVLYAGPAHELFPDAANAFTDVPEGTPNQPGTCSHIQWQPGTDAHAQSVLFGLDGDELAARAEEHAFDSEIVARVTA